MVHVTPPSSVSSAGLRESDELNAFHTNGNLQTQQRLPQQTFAHVNRYKSLTSRILQPRHPNRSRINSDQKIAELLKAIFLCFFRDNEGSTPVFQPRTQTCRANPLVTELEARCALDCLALIRALVLMGFSLRSSKPLAPRLPGCFTSHFKLPRFWQVGEQQ